MDVVYDFLESVHIFIPIVAVVFIVLVIFVCGTSGRDKQPDPAYLTKLNELDVQQRRERKPPRPAAASKPLPVSRPAQSTGESSTNTVRQRKNKKATDSPVKSPKRADSFSESPDTQEQDDGWVTVTPKRSKTRPQKDASSQDDTDTHHERVRAKEIEADDDVVEDVAEVEIGEEAIESGATHTKEAAESEEDSPTAANKQKKSRKKQQAQSKKQEPAFVVEEPVLVDDKPSSVAHDSSAQTSGQSAAEPQQPVVEPSQEEHQPSDAEGGDGEEGEDEWTTQGEKKKKKKKKSKKLLASKNAPAEAADDSPTRAGNSEGGDDDEDGDGASFSPVERKKRRPRRE